VVSSQVRDENQVDLHQATAPEIFVGLRMAFPWHLGLTSQSPRVSDVPLLSRLLPPMQNN
jgi:hypothetical protein